jgi:hypothetical protein
MKLPYEFPSTTKVTSVLYTDVYDKSGTVCIGQKCTINLEWVEQVKDYDGTIRDCTPEDEFDENKLLVKK